MQPCFSGKIFLFSFWQGERRWGLTRRQALFLLLSLPARFSSPDLPFLYIHTPFLLSYFLFLRSGRQGQDFCERRCRRQVAIFLFPALYTQSDETGRDGFARLRIGRDKVNKSSWAKRAHVYFSDSKGVTPFCLKMCSLTCRNSLDLQLAKMEISSQ